MKSKIFFVRYLEVIWYKTSERSIFCSKRCCMVANPIKRGSSKPTWQLFISTPFFCLGFMSVGFTINILSFKAPSMTERGKLVERIERTLLSQPSMLIPVALEKRRAGPTHTMDRYDGRPISYFVELLDSMSRSAVVISTLWFVSIPATWPLKVSCHWTCIKTTYYERNKYSI